MLSIPSYSSDLLMLPLQWPTIDCHRYLTPTKHCKGCPNQKQPESLLFKNVCKKTFAGSEFEYMRIYPIQPTQKNIRVFMCVQPPSLKERKLTKLVLPASCLAWLVLQRRTCTLKLSKSMVLWKIGREPQRPKGAEAEADEDRCRDIEMLWMG